MTVWLVHFALALAAFFIINWLGRHAISAGYYQISFIAEADDAPAFNAVFRILAPLVFSVLTATALYAFGFDRFVTGFYWVTILYFAIRWSFNLALGRGQLLLWSRQVTIAAISIGLAYLLYEKVLRFRTNLLPDARTLANELWIVIVLFLYATLNKVAWPFGASAAKRRRIYIRDRYRAYERRFGSVITSEAPSRLTEAASYAVLIYESFNRPPLYQWIERHVLHPIGLSKSLGPMQVQSDEPLDNGQSVRLGVRKIVESLPGVESSLRADFPERFPPHDAEAPVPPYLYDLLVMRLASRYNVRSDYPTEVSGIFDELRNVAYPDLKESAQAEHVAVG